MITRKLAAEKINSYLQHDISLADLVNWAENAMQNEDFDEQYHDQIRDVVSKLGVADVKDFGLLWEDFEKLLKTLGYKVNINIQEAAN
jgi:polyhydroxyalkanoate synthesis regulator phasin